MSLLSFCSLFDFPSNSPFLIFAPFLYPSPTTFPRVSKQANEGKKHGARLLRPVRLRSFPPSDFRSGSCWGEILLCGEINFYERTEPCNTLYPKPNNTAWACSVVCVCCDEQDYIGHRCSVYESSTSLHSVTHALSETHITWLTNAIKTNTSSSYLPSHSCPLIYHAYSSSLSYLSRALFTSPRLPFP